VWDLTLALAIMAVGVVDIIFFEKDVSPLRAAPALSIPLFAGMSLPLALRRRKLWLAYLLIETAMVVSGQLLLFTSLGIGFLLVANVLLFSVGEQNSGLVTMAATLGQLGYIYSIEFRLPAKDRTIFDDAIYLLPLFGFAAFAGWAQRRRRRLTAELEQSLAEVERERELLSGQAVAQERTRIAGELHGLVVRGVERMIGQAASARRELAHEPSLAHESIGSIERTGRRTLVEMRRLLGVLRRADQDADVPTAIPVSPDVAEALSAAPEPEDGRASLVHRVRTWLAVPRVADVLIVAVLGGLMILEFARTDPGDPTLQGWVPHVLGPVIVLSLLFRRAAPLTVLAVAAIDEFLWIMATTNTPGSADRALLVAVYSVAAYKSASWTPVAVAMGMFAWVLLPIQNLCICLIDIGAFSTFAVIAGYSMQAGRRLNRQLEEQAEVLRRTRQERVRLAVAEERTRVARDMHDVVGHGVTVMVVQAGGARMVATTDVALAAETLAEIERIGADVIAELGSLVGALDPGSDTLEPEPREEAPDVEALVARLTRTGQAIDFVQEGDVHPLDLGLQISVYRIVQEALTNVRKHAPGAGATVTIRYQPEAVEVEVANQPTPTPRQGRAVPGAGQGLVGIRERAAIFGGRVDARPSPDGGFRVFVELPVELVPA